MPKPAATPAPENDANDLGLDVISQAAGRLGVKLPHDPAASAPAKQPAANPGTAHGGNEPQPDDQAPPRESGEDDDAYAARLQDQGYDDEQVTAALQAYPAGDDDGSAPAGDQPPAREDGEDDDAYAARLQDQGYDDEQVAAALEAHPVAGNDDKEDDEEDDGEDAAAKAKAAAQKAKDDADLKKLPEPVRKTVQSIIDKRIGRITAKTSAETEALKQRLAAVEAERDEAKATADGKPARLVVVDNVHPLLLDPSEEAIAKYLETVEKFEDWAAEHEDGYEPSAEELAKGYKPATKAEISQRLRAIKREREKLVPQARELIGKRTTADAEARKLLPAFFDATKPEYQAARSLLREQPELKRFPDYMLRAAEVVLGRKALADLRAAGGKPPAKKPATPPRASRVPGGGSPAKGGFGERKPAGPDAPAAVKSYLKTPSRENLAAAAKVFLGTT